MSPTSLKHLRLWATASDCLKIGRHGLAGRWLSQRGGCRVTNDPWYLQLVLCFLLVAWDISSQLLLQPPRFPAVTVTDSSPSWNHMSKINPFFLPWSWYFITVLEKYTIHNLSPDHQTPASISKFFYFKIYFFVVACKAILSALFLECKIVLWFIYFEVYMCINV